MKIKDSFKKVFDGKSRVMVVFAHPDDAEIFAGGTIARLIESGIVVRVVKMTSGNRGSRQEKISKSELGSVREREDKQSMKVLGVKDEDNIYLRIDDGEIENDIETIGKIAKQIRIFKPDLIITHNPEDVVIRFDKETFWINHRDHRHTGKSAIDAAYPYSRDLSFFPEQLKEKGVSSHTTTEFLLVDYWEGLDLVYIDVKDQLPKKVGALSRHKSQYSVKDATSSSEFFTKMSGDKFFERFRYVVAD